MFLNVTHHGHTYRVRSESGINCLCRFIDRLGPEAALILDALLLSKFNETQKAS